MLYLQYRIGGDYAVLDSGPGAPARPCCGSQPLFLEEIITAFRLIFLRPKPFPTEIYWRARLAPNKPPAPAVARLKRWG